MRMKRCKKCNERHTPLAMYSDGECVFCKLGIDEIEWQGDTITRERDKKVADELSEREEE